MLKRVKSLIKNMLFGALKAMIPKDIIKPIGSNQLERLGLPIVFSHHIDKDEVVVYSNGLALAKKDKGHGEPYKTVFPVLKAKLRYRFVKGQNWVCSDPKVLDGIDAEMVLWDYAESLIERNANQKHNSHSKTFDEEYNKENDHHEYLASYYMNPEQIFLKNEQKRVLSESLKVLNDNQRQAIQLYYFEDYTIEEISKLIEKSVSTVHYRLKKSLELLSESLSYD